MSAMVRLGFINAGRLVNTYDENAQTLMGVTMEDVDTVINSVGFDPVSADQIRQQIIDSGRLIDSYESSYQIKM